MQKNTENPFIRYFKKPLLGASLTTGYGFHNSLIHIPVIFMFVYAGACIANSGGKALMSVYLVVALYTARDMMVAAYHRKVVPAVLWALFIPFIVFREEVAEYLVLSQGDSITVTMVLLALFLLYVPVSIKKILKF